MKYSQAAGHFNTLNLTESESESQANSQVIFDTIATNSTSFNQDFIQATYEIITNQDQPPSSKFSATLLLVKVTELKNITFMRQLASSKEILNYIFQSAQFDRKKPLDERGQKFFSKKPTQEEKEIGVDYIRLVLEALQYWAITYGSINRQEPGYIYHLMFTTLSQNITFPETTIYIEKSQVETDDSQFKQEFNQAHYEEEKEKTEKEGEENEVQEEIQVEVPTQVKENLAQEHVNTAIVSGEEFMKNYKLCILSQSSSYNDDFLKAVNEILASTQHTSMNKFYALYLLAKMTEFGADELINALIKHHDLLNKLFQNCQIDKSKSVEERGKKIFSKNPSPTDSFFGQCYVNLAIESIYYWGMHYGSKDKKDAKNVFWLMYTTLESVGIKMPKTLEYFETKVDSTIANIETRLDNSLNRQVKTSR